MEDEPLLVLVRDKNRTGMMTLCRGHILNTMSNTLFHAYHNVPTTKELRAQLQEVYMKEDVTSKRFIVTRFNIYRMTDSRSVMEQLDQLSQHNQNMDENIIVTSIVDKLPPPWKTFRNSLKHKKEYLTLEELRNHLCIEKDLRRESKEVISKINNVEENHVRGNTTNIRDLNK